MGKHYARGLLRLCWQRHRWHGTIDRFPLAPKATPKPRTSPATGSRAPIRRADDVLDAYAERARGAAPGISLAMIAKDLKMHPKTLYKVLQRGRHRGDRRAEIRLPRGSFNEYRRFRAMYFPDEA